MITNILLILFLAFGGFFSYKLGKYEDSYRKIEDAIEYGNLSVKDIWLRELNEDFTDVEIFD